jgi:hypothetical protein
MCPKDPALIDQMDDGNYKVTLHTVPNAYGTGQLSLKADDGELNSTVMIDYSIDSVNDSPIFARVEPVSY